jgi:dihydrodipicolinate synthase/N-acetylneuraminate lyase
MSNSVPEKRQIIVSRAFRGKIAPLWCPLLTHYDRDGRIDAARMAAHLAHLSPHIKGFLIPGSTGDGWELDGVETRQVLGIAFEQAARLDLQVLIGVLKTGRGEARESILETMASLRARSGKSDNEGALAAARVCGFTVCPPRGKELTQDAIQHDLEGVLQTGLPVALYQLPQITENEMSPRLVATLAGQFANFVLLKDTSGLDHVAKAGLDLGGVFLVRGAEGDYAQWLIGNGGPYQGLLLSTANCFARHFHEMIEYLGSGQFTRADNISTRVTAMVSEAFALVLPIHDGNPFANANKAMDHFFAHGPKAAAVTPPRLHAGSSLPFEVIRAIGDALQRHDLMPAKGYWE